MPTTQAANLWTPGEVAMLITTISTVFLSALTVAILKVIEAAKNARVAVIEASKATAQAQANSQQMNGLQQQVSAVALSQTPPPLVSVLQDRDGSVTKDAKPVVLPVAEMSDAEADAIIHRLAIRQAALKKPHDAPKAT
jgi:hypothetical protein